MTEQEQNERANERMALLLKWTQRDGVMDPGRPVWVSPDGQRYMVPAPDFSQWDRFPELQEFLKNLCEPRSEDRRERFECAEQYDQIQREIWNRLGAPRSWSGDGWDLTAEYVLNITPAILRDSIWAVVGEEAEVGSG